MLWLTRVLKMVLLEFGIFNVGSFVLLYVTIVSPGIFPYQVFARQAVSEDPPKYSECVTCPWELLVSMEYPDGL